MRPFPSSMRAAAITPAERTGADVARFPARGSLPRTVGGSASALGVSRPARRSLRVAARMVAEPPRRPFFVGVLRPVSLPPPSAPTATGWSDSCRAGFAPAEERRLHGALQSPLIRPKGNARRVIRRDGHRSATAVATGCFLGQPRPKGTEPARGNSSWRSRAGKPGEGDRQPRRRCPTEPSYGGLLPRRHPLSACQPPVFSHGPKRESKPETTPNRNMDLARDERLASRAQPGRVHRSPRHGTNQGEAGRPRAAHGPGSSALCGVYAPGRKPMTKPPFRSDGLL